MIESIGEFLNSFFFYLLVIFFFVSIIYFIMENYTGAIAAVLIAFLNHKLMSRVAENKKKYESS